MTRLEHHLWPALRRYWHPVAYVTEIGDRPRPVRLLGERLVVARLGEQVACFRDLCVHRATALSLGRVEDGELVCAYHGWRYAPDGRCVHIPALPADRPIPARARIERFACEVQHGLVWVCLADDPVVGMPPYRGVRRPGLPPGLRPAAGLARERGTGNGELRRRRPLPVAARGHPRLPRPPEVPVFESTRWARSCATSGTTCRTHAPDRPHARLPPAPAVQHPPAQGPRRRPVRGGADHRLSPGRGRDHRLPGDLPQLPPDEEELRSGWRPTS